MKYVVMVIAAVVVLSGFTSCSEALKRVDSVIQKGAPTACRTAAKIYNGWLGTDTGGARERAIVNAIYAKIYEPCKNPSAITATQLYDIGNETVEMVNKMRK